MRGVTSARIASNASLGRALPHPRDAHASRRRRAAARAGPECSTSVVTTSSSGPRPSPARTMLQPSVVEPVSATVLRRRRGAAPRVAARSRSRASHQAAPSSRLRCGPRSRSRRRCCSSASDVARASGPNVPAFRYASRSSTGNCARAAENSTDLRYCLRARPLSLLALLLLAAGDRDPGRRGATPRRRRLLPGRRPSRRERRVRAGLRHAGCRRRLPPRLARRRHRALLRLAPVPRIQRRHRHLPALPEPRRRQPGEDAAGAPGGDRGRAGDAAQPRTCR